MGYRFINIRTGETYSCPNEFWLDILKAASENGWKPKGTRLSLEREIDDTFDDSFGRMYNLFLVISAHARCLEWDGNYTEKEYQVVGQEDIANLLEELIYMGTDPLFLDFLEKGPFEIGPG